ncbi:MAG: hypothetical protein HY000_32735 [Planctomycetes bacterium]|nr:hypothetical protein [Planctomycetota bacterium]
MQQITLDKVQSEIIVHAQGKVQIRDHTGKVLGYLSRPFTAEQIAEAKRRLASDQPRYTTEQVLAHLRSLDPS